MTIAGGVPPVSPDGRIAHRLNAIVHARMEAHATRLAPVRGAERVTKRHQPGCDAGRCLCHRDRLGPVSARIFRTFSVISSSASSHMRAPRQSPPDRCGAAGISAVGVIDELRRRRTDRTEVAVIEGPSGSPSTFVSLPFSTCISVLQPPWQLRQTLFRTLTLPGTSFSTALTTVPPNTVCIDFRELSRSSQAPRFAPAVAELALPP